MNDRDLSRGKTIYGPRPHFVTGHYVSVPRPMIISAKTRIGGGWDADDVDPATIGRCTGLRDKNGTLIFEGDIVRKEMRKNQYYSTEIVWLHTGFKRHGEHGYHPIHSNELKIIGNIHDNPELLECAERNGDE